MSPKEAFPIALCSVMNLAGVLEKGVMLSACHQDPPSWEVGESPSHILLNHVAAFTLYLTTFLSPQGLSHQTRRVLLIF